MFKKKINYSSEILQNNDVALALLQMIQIVTSNINPETASLLLQNHFNQFQGCSIKWRIKINK